MRYDLCVQTTASACVWHGYAMPEYTCDTFIQSSWFRLSRCHRIQLFISFPRINSHYFCSCFAFRMSIQRMHAGTVCICHRYVCNLDFESKKNFTLILLNSTFACYLIFSCRFVCRFFVATVASEHIVPCKICVTFHATHFLRRIHKKLFPAVIIPEVSLLIELILHAFCQRPQCT